MSHSEFDTLRDSGPLMDRHQIHDHAGPFSITALRHGNTRVRRNYIFLGVAIVAMILIGTIIGIAVGVKDKKKNNNNPHVNPQPACAAGATSLIDSSLQIGDNAWNQLAYISDTFGHRLSGSQNLEDAIDYIYNKMVEDGLENVKKEPVMVPHWVRGEEWATLNKPLHKSLGMLGLGGSVATNNTLTASVYVVKSFQELQGNCSKAENKIVVYNQDWAGSYGATVPYRRNGATEAAKCGAVAALVRSVTDFSIYTPHTGAMAYEDGVTKIPTASITVEDAEMLYRLQSDNQEIEISLLMSAQTLPDAQSHNIMGEVTGQTPNEVVVLGGHIDSWDVGEGSMDDLGGVIVAWEAVKLIKKMADETGIRPKRTIRAVGWTNEENGGRGGDQYFIDHQNELTVLAIESDGGVFKPSGIGLTSAAAPETRDIITQIAALLYPIAAHEVGSSGGGADVDPLLEGQVPVAGLNVDRTTYFWYHHTQADTPGVLKPSEINLCVATFSVYSYCVAEWNSTLPRNPVA